jgi:hypothetical protein
MLSTEALLAGGSVSFEVEVPAAVLQPAAEAETNGTPESGGTRTVRIRPLTVHDLQLISRAASENETLIGALMVQRALVEPELSVAEVTAAHVGLVQFLLHRVNEISGITVTADELAAAAQAPLAKAALILSREFGWTPDEVASLTVGQMLLHLQMLAEAPQP